MVTVERALPMLKVWPTAFGCSSARRIAVDDVVDVAPGADLRAVVVDREASPRSARSMKGWIAPSPTWRGP